MRTIIAALGLLSLGCSPETAVEPPPAELAQTPAFAPGQRTLVHAHNCYPYHGEHADRLERALATGTPIVIEQDLIWHEGRSIVAHNCPCTGEEPSLEEHFFQRVRPVVERALAEPDPAGWPLLILHLDLKTEEPEHLSAVRALLEKYDAWLTTAPRTDTPAIQEPLAWGPVMVVTEGFPAREKGFHDDVPVGDRIRIFGGVLAAEGPASVQTPPEAMIAGGPTNYRRWWNLPWSAVEAGGQREAGEWTTEDQARLRAIVDYGHELGIFVRFYCLNGHPADDPNDWGRRYNFGSLEAARTRWRAAKAAGVDWLATDQYEELAAELR